MATTEATGGLDHPTVIPENFEPADDEDAAGEADDGEPADRE